MTIYGDTASFECYGSASVQSHPLDQCHCVKHYRHQTARVFDLSHLHHVAFFVPTGHHFRWQVRPPCTKNASMTRQPNVLSVFFCLLSKTVFFCSVQLFRSPSQSVHSRTGRCFWDWGWGWGWQSESPFVHEAPEHLHSGTLCNAQFDLLACMRRAA